MTSTPASRRPPALAVASWGVAVAVLAVLGVAVARYLARPAVSSMNGMSTAEALSRARGGAPLRPLLGPSLLSAWQLDAVAVAVVVLLGAWYLTAVALVPVRSPGARWPWQRTACFVAGLAVCILATNASIAVYDQVLFSAHMLGHLALVMLAPALLMAGHPLSLAVAASRRPDRVRRVLRGPAVSLLTAPPVALACYAAVIVGTHLTGLMDSIMRDTWAGQLEHLLYLVAGCQFFAVISGDEALRWRLSIPARWLLLALAMAVDTFTGVVLLQSTTAIAMRPDSALAVDALSDTRTGGAIMWFGGDGLMLAVMLVLVVAWLRRDEPTPSSGWLDSARRTTFAHHTAAADPESLPDDLDEDEGARQSYNAWLASLDRKP